MSFSRKTRFIWERPTLSADNVGFFLKRNLLYLRETHIILSDNVRFLDKPTLSADNAGYSREI